MLELDLLPAIEGLQFIEKGHKYKFAHPTMGDLFPSSVSQVLQETEAKATNFSHWRNKLMRDGMSEPEADAFMAQHRQTRAAIGTKFHSLVQRSLFGDPPPSDADEAVWMREIWDAKFRPAIKRVRIIEQPLIHRSCFYVGTPDLVAELDFDVLRSTFSWILLPPMDGPGIIDWKTVQEGKYKVRQEWALQNAGYAQLVNSCYGIEPQWAMNVMVSASGIALKVWNRADLELAWRRFAGFLTEHHALRAMMGSLPNRIALTALSYMC